ncbi:MAG TPA: hypothetical protein VFK86_16785 [Bauldia sp.]|nr:hypothetical protein [Bauldia sp.]
MTLVGVGAGFAAALLFISPLGGTLLALPLFLLSSLPVAIAGLAWGTLSSAIAAAGAAGTIAVAISLPAGIIYLALFGAPTAWACSLAGLSRSNESSGTMEWYPIGRILLHGAAATALGLVVVGFIIGYDPEGLTDEITGALLRWLSQAPDGSAPPTAAELEPFVRLNVAIVPFTTAMVLVILFVVNLWLAARVAEASGRLVRPRDRLWTAVLPNEALFACAVAVVLAFFPGPVGHAAGVVAGAFAGALALIGLAVVHATTLGSSIRILILVAVYVLLVFFGGLPLVLLAFLGIAEAFLHLRARRFSGAPPL